MERMTLQQQVPVYHVCQECGGDGCAVCSDLCILDGDIQLDPEWDGEISSSDVFSTEARCASVASLFARMPARPVHSEWNRSYFEDCGLWGDK